MGTGHEHHRSDSVQWLINETVKQLPTSNYVIIVHYHGGWFTSWWVVWLLLSTAVRVQLFTRRQP